MPPKHEKSVKVRCRLIHHVGDEGGMQLACEKDSNWVRRATATTSAPGRLKTKSVGSLAQKPKMARIKKGNWKARTGRN